MFKKLILFTLFSLVINLSYASDTQELIKRTYKFKPAEPLLITNPAFWQVTMNCKISSSDLSDNLYAVMKHKSGKINGVELKEGQNMSVTVHNGDAFKTIAKSGAKVEITNFGNSLVTANCQT